MGTLCRRGHTLLELIAVMAIILILLALSFPYYAKAVKMAWDVTHGTGASQ